MAFRARTLPAARDNARANGFRGAMYPWEADERGEETTPQFAIQNARSEIHVNGDVALAQWQYYLADGRLHLAGQRRLSRHPGNRRLLGQPLNLRLGRRTLSHRERGLGGGRADRGDR